MTDAPETSAAPGPAAAEKAAPAASAPRAWARRIADRVPAKWLSGIGAAVVLAATAAFGGLAPVEAAAPPALELGEAHEGPGLSLSVVAVELVGEYPAATLYETPGARVLLVTVDAVDTDTEPRRSDVTGSLTGIRVVRTSADAAASTPADETDAAPTVVRADDGTRTPWLQPGVPVRAVIAWPVPEDAFAVGDEVRIELPSATKATGSAFVTGTYWTDAVVGATVTTTVTERGADGEEGA